MKAMRGEPIGQISSELLTWLVSDSIAKAVLAPKGLTISGATFNEFVDLTNVDMPVPLHLRGCTFKAGLSLTGLRVPYLELNKSTIHDGMSARELDVRNTFSAQGLTSGPIDLCDAKIGGSLELSGLIIENNNTSCLKGDVKNYWTRESEEWVVLAMDRLTVEGSFYLESTKAKRAKVNGSVSLRNAKVRGALVLSGGRFGSEHPRWRDSQRFRVPAIRAAGIEVGGAVFLCGNNTTDRRFISNGAVEFPFSTLKDRLIVGHYTEEYKHNEIPNDDLPPNVFANLKVYNGRDHRGGECRTALRLTCAEISGGLQVNASALDGMVDLENAQIGRSVDIRFTWIKPPIITHVPQEREKAGCSIYADGVQVADSIMIESSCLDGEISLIEAEVSERFSASHVTIRGRQDGVRNHSAVFARGATLGAVHLEGHSAIGGTDPNGKVLVQGTVSFAVCRVRDDLRLTNLEVTANFGIDPTTDQDRFSDRAGLVDLSYAQIGAAARLTYLKINEPKPATAATQWPQIAALNARAMKAGGDLDMSSAKIVAYKKLVVDLSNADIAGRWEATGVKLFLIDSAARANASEAVCVDASEARFGGSVVFGGKDDCPAASGTLSFIGASFAHDFDVASGSFGPPGPVPDAGQSAGANTAAKFEQWRKFPVLNLARARVAGDFRWGTATNAGSRPVGIVSLQSANINRLRDSPKWWPRGEKGVDELTGYWRLDGLLYEGLHTDSARA
ncbi:MAG: hypothetical protein ACKO1J_00035, partial [Tagaea sp.]